MKFLHVIKSKSQQVFAACTGDKEIGSPPVLNSNCIEMQAPKLAWAIKAKRDSVAEWPRFIPEVSRPEREAWKPIQCCKWYHLQKYPG